MMNARRRRGIVYSTNPDFEYNMEDQKDEVTLPADQQSLFVWIDSKGRNGKTATLIKGFKGNIIDLEGLAQEIKRHCCTGGTVKDGAIIIQGNLREKILVFLISKGFKKAKKAGG